MAKPTLHAAITALALPLAEAAGLTLWGIELMGEGRIILRVYVESEQGVNIDQCATISRQLGLALDVEDIMPSAYTLEVSSPGLTRPFFEPEQLKAYLGKPVEVTLHDPMPEFPRRKRFQGTLANVEEKAFTLLLDALALPEEDASPAAGGQAAYINWDNVRKVHLVHIFPQKGGTPKKAPKPHAPKTEENPQ